MSAGNNNNNHFQAFPLWNGGTKGTQHPGSKAEQAIEQQPGGQLQQGVLYPIQPLPQSGAGGMMLGGPMSDSIGEMASASYAQAIQGGNPKSVGGQEFDGKNIGEVGVNANAPHAQGRPLVMANQNGVGQMPGMNGMNGMVPLPFMENHIATQALVADQQRKIEQLQKDLGAAQVEIQRLKNQAMALEKERSQKETQGEDGKKSSSRYWTQEEHERFLEGLKLYGHKEIKAISRHVRTRNATQVRTHAQKYYLRLAREKNKKASRDGGDSPDLDEQKDEKIAGKENSARDGLASTERNSEGFGLSSTIQPSRDKPPLATAAEEGGADGDRIPLPSLSASPLEETKMGSKGSGKRVAIHEAKAHDQEKQMYSGIASLPRPKSTSSVTDLLDRAPDQMGRLPTRALEKQPLTLAGVMDRETTENGQIGSASKRPRYGSLISVPDGVSLLPQSGLNSASREHIPSFAGLPRPDSSSTLGLLSGGTDGDRPTFSFGQYQDGEDGRPDSSEAAGLGRSGFRRTGSILNLITKPSSGMLTEVPSTDRLLEFGMRESLSFSQLPNMHVDEFDGLDAKDTALNLP
ncbi:hypothetical protein NDN08_001528 [Rhodosorus marinus]|uniref:HTH myb-type domain-containing protein n=1 Tax=Rhodosorus marinus TaxID=101924 RepID=A0AAV8UR44_9RHOD|nr:hypothetical protein NDN08_001528 [Rhodosorus marinus]